MKKWTSAGVDHRVPCTDTPLDVTEAEKKSAAVNEANQEVLSGQDASLSWGRSGGVETNHERNAPTLRAESGSGFQGAPFVAPVNPMPSSLGSTMTPASGRGAEGNWNSASIYENTKIG